jgi:hypothetical protein
MQDSGIPAKFPIPWANSAGGGFIRPIPQASQISIQNGAASLTDGFPPNCFLPIASGGSWPFGQDANGILKQVTQWLQWAQAGGPIPYDATFQSAIGGYPKGAVVASVAVFGKSWESTVDNNVTNPDTGGAGWVTAYGGRLLFVRYLAASATYFPVSGTNMIEVELVGGGGAGGGAIGPGAGNVSAGAGGGGGGWGRKLITSGFSGVSYTIGAGGTGVLGAAGNNGGATSFGGFITASGGIGGTLGSPLPSTTNSLNGQGDGGSCSGGDLNVIGYAGDAGFYANIPVSGKGGGSPYGDGAPYVSFVNSGLNAVNYGSAGSGASLQPPFSANAAGGRGASGLIIVREYS